MTPNKTLHGFRMQIIPIPLDMTMHFTGLILMDQCTGLMLLLGLKI
ncbi:hypothetical protein D3OALGA1CA_1981 [Olavius algarvensis associated proteobacterium Delta 3]|nr:hypothetical protein D3OALGA1CA_1981 [Olavius algarvensis associated proteobacterium Delta 3]CAB5119224.1 hypothetical protein D3OALGB2SA_2874 [Olavius algarvensis associated proteobacterium Delta 3]